MGVTVHLRSKPITELGSSDTPLQSPLWGQLKTSTGWRARGYSFRSDLGRGDLLTLARSSAAGRAHLYVPFGPEIDIPSEQHGPFLEALSEELRSQAAPGCVFVRYDLPWESPYTDSGLSTAPSIRVREMRMNFGTSQWNLRKSPTDVQPPDTVQLSPQQQDEQLLTAMKPKTRYNIRLSTRRGVAVRRGGPRDLADWYSILRETAARKRIVCADVGYYESLLRLAEKQPDSATRVSFLVAYRDSTLLGGVILAANPEVALYLYGATSYRHRQLMASYALQWEAMRWARRRGCSIYDLHGIPPDDDPSHPMHGLYRFKTGFGGRRVHRRGCWDYPFDTDRYHALGSVEFAAPGFHLREA